MAHLNDISMATVFNAPTAFGCSKTGRPCADVKKEMQKQATRTEQQAQIKNYRDQIRAKYHPAPGQAPPQAALMNLNNGYISL